MAEQIIKVPSAKILKIISEGDIHLNDLQMTFQAIQYFYEVENYNKAIIDITEQKSLPDISSFNSLITYDFTNIYFAFVFSNKTKTLSQIMKLEEIRFNKATYNFFRDEDHAISWLNDVQHFFE